MFRPHQRFTSIAVALVALAGCSSGGDGGGGGRTVSLRGGAGATGAGGTGGSVWVYSEGGDVEVKRGGTVPAAPGWRYTAPALGENPRTISTNTTLEVDGAVFGDDGVNSATGLWVKRGAVLTLSAPAGFARASFTLPAGLRIDGTLRMAPLGDTLDATGLDLAVGAVAVTGKIEALGGDAAEGLAGGNGGDLYVDVAGDTFITGSIVTRGGKGATGGDGGDIDFTVSGPAYDQDPVPAPTTIAVTGLTDSSGGEGLAGVGGFAGYNDVWGTWSAGGHCNAYVSGRMIARGGNGTTGGGDGDDIYVSSCSRGWAVLKGGAFDSSGGDATVDGPGGDADWNELDAAGDKVWASGVMRARGGNGAGSGAGGAGDWIGVSSNTTWSAAPGQLGGYVAVEVDVEGGSGATGGAAGEFEVWDDGGGDTVGLHLLGYAGFDAAGGQGVAAGGGGGSVEIYAIDWYVSDTERHVGNVRNEAALDVRGGVASAGAGGAGGSVDVYSTGVAAVEDDTREVHALGAVLAQGGAGTSTGGAGGSAYFYDRTLLHVTGAVNVSGGASGTDAGGLGGTVTFASEGEVEAHASVLASGGASTAGAGGAGGTVTSTGAAALLHAVIADGGAAPVGLGGAGGAVTLDSTVVESRPSPVMSLVSVRGGAGVTAGAVGAFTRDGAAAALVDGQLRP